MRAVVIAFVLLVIVAIMRMDLPRPDANQPTVSRDLIAGAAWLRANAAAERQDEPAFRAAVRLAMAAAPRARFYRIQSARMLSYDVPAWRENREPNAPAALRTRWREDAVREGIAWLADGERHLGPDARLRFEAALLTWHGLRDITSSAARFKSAAELPGAPWEAGRLHAQLLVDLGRVDEARQWLEQWAPRLPDDVPSAQRALVMQRLAALRALAPARP